MANKTNLNVLFGCIIIILILPFFPFWEYSNTAPFILTIAIGLGVFFIPQKGIQNFSLVDLGFAILTISLSVSLVNTCYEFGSLPLGNNYMIYTLMILTYVLLNRLLGASIKYEKITQLLFIAFLVLVTYVLIVGINKAFNYSRLTSAFSYEDGIGNISQIAMYCSFYLIAIFYRSKKYSQLGLCTVLALLVSYILQSKLILITVLFVFLAKVLNRFDFKKRLFVIIILGISFCSMSFFFLPNSLNGRIDTLKISWSNVDYLSFWGEGLGGYDAFINAVFESGKAVNTIGEISHLAFNDFTQIFIELGYPGIVGLLLIFIGLINKQNFLFVLALGFILLFMFPLQYLESAVLFSLIVFLLSANEPALLLNRSISIKNLKPVFVIGIFSIFGFIGLEMTMFKKWGEYNELLESKINQEENLQAFYSLEQNFKSMDEYYLSLGIQLLKNRKHNEAIKIFRKAQKLNASYKAYIHLGDCYFEMAQFEEAIKQYDKAMLLRPAHLYPVYKKVFSLYDLGKQERARNYWELKQDEFKVIRSSKMQIMYSELENLLKK